MWRNWKRNFLGSGHSASAVRAHCTRMCCVRRKTCPIFYMRKKAQRDLSDPQLVLSDLILNGSRSIYIDMPDEYGCGENKFARTYHLSSRPVFWIGAYVLEPQCVSQHWPNSKDWGKNCRFGACLRFVEARAGMLGLQADCERSNGSWKRKLDDDGVGACAVKRANFARDEPLRKQEQEALLIAPDNRHTVPAARADGPASPWDRFRYSPNAPQKQPVDSAQPSCSTGWKCSRCMTPQSYSSQCAFCEKKLGFCCLEPCMACRQLFCWLCSTPVWVANVIYI